MATIYANSSKPKVRLWQEREEKESARFKRNKWEEEAEIQLIRDPLYLSLVILKL